MEHSEKKKEKKGMNFVLIKKENYTLIAAADTTEIMPADRLAVS